MTQPEIKPETELLRKTDSPYTLDKIKAVEEALDSEVARVAREQLERVQRDQVAMGQPTNADLEIQIGNVEIQIGNLLSEIERWHTTPRTVDFTPGELERIGTLLERRLYPLIDRSANNGARLVAIDTRLETLEAAFGIAASKGAAGFDNLDRGIAAFWTHIEGRIETLIDLQLRAAKRHRRGKKKG